MKPRHVPVIRQMNSFECGAACLAMILGYFGRKTRLEEVRRKCDPGRNGVTARTIVTAAAQFGLKSRAYRLPLADFRGIALPCVVYWNGNHFVVLEYCSPDRVGIVDPDRGRRDIPREEFEESFSGVALEFEPLAEFDTAGTVNPHPMWTFLRQMFRASGTSRILGQIVAASLLLQAFSLALPVLTKVIVDRVLPHGRLDGLNIVILGGLVAALMYSSATYVRARLLLRLETRLDSHLMAGFFSHLLSLPFRFFQLRSSGDLVMRLSSNATIREALSSYTTSSLLDGSMVLALLGVLLYLSPPVGLAALALALMEITVLLLTTRRLNALVGNQIAAQSLSQSCLVESLAGILTLKASGAEPATLARWRGLLDRQIEAAQQRGRYSAAVEGAMVAIRTFAPLVLLWLGSRLVLQGSLTLGSMLAVNGLAAVFLQPVTSLVMSAQRLQLAGAHLDRISDVLEAPPEQSADLGPLAFRLSGAIDVKNVSFRYDANAPLVLRNISLSIQPGEKVALVGRTGSGKSTLAKLLLGLYTPTEGRIEYDGVPVEAMNLQSLRRHWGTCLQEPFLFGTTIRENIAFHDPGMAADRIVEAAEIAEVHDDIVQMPMGYETRLDEAGHSLSGGQRQRIAIARAVAAKPVFLLLDESTSHLDTVTEAAVDRRLDELSCTRIVIAHRLSTIQNADRIVVLEDGGIVEQGSHEELIVRGGAYAALIEAQVETLGRVSTSKLPHDDDQRLVQAAGTPARAIRALPSWRPSTKGVPMAWAARRGPW